MLAVLALTLLTQCGPQGPIYSCPARMGAGTAPPAPFSFVLGQAQNGTAACTGTDLVAAYNGASNPVTVTRSTAAWCTKGNETKDIANGDMVLISANKPRWMPGGEGDGGLGVAVWASRTNYLLRSQAFDNAVWRKVGCSSGSCADDLAITVNANAAVAPDGTMTAEEVVCGSSCILEQDACPVDRAVRGVYIRLAPLGGGGVDTDTANFKVGGNVAIQKNVTSASWTRIIDDDQSDNAAYFAIYYYTTNTLPAKTFYVWQADCQRNSAGAEYATHPLPPPITTTSAAVTTDDEVVQVANYTPAWSSLSLSATVQPENSSVVAVPLTTGNAIDGVSIRTGARLTCRSVIGGVADSVVGAVDLTVNQQVALSCNYDGVSRLEACTDGTCVDAGSAAPPRHLTTTIGSEQNGAFGSFVNGVVKEASVTSAATRDVYLFGDSIVEGNTAGVGHQPQFIIHSQLGNRVAIQNAGTATYTIEQCKASWDATLATIVAAGMASRSYMMVQCGTNSNGAPDDGGTATANVLSQLKAMLAAGADAGVHVLGSTITPRTNPACAAFVVPVNAALQAWAATQSITVADTFTTMNVRDGGCALDDPWDVGDALHPNDAGVNVETQAWISAGAW